MPYVDDAQVAPEPVSRQERRDLADEREAEQYAELYELVKAEREASGKSDAPIMTAAETMRRLRLGTK